MTSKSYLTIIVLTGLLGLRAGATPISTPALVQRCVDEGYATFYDDNACTQNGGEPVSLTNDSCLANEIGRNSIYIQASCFGGGASMVWSPGNNCDCQNDCAEVQTFGDGYENGCWDLNGHAGASSFHFIEQGCDSNNC